MKKKIITIVVLACAILIGIVVFFQWNNIKAAQYFVFMDKETLETKIDENDKVITDALKEYVIEVPEFSEEELENLANGTTDKEALIDRILNETTPIDPEQENKPIDPPITSEKPIPTEVIPPNPVVNNDKAIKEQIATMYVLKAQFVGKLEAIVSQTISEFYLLPASEQTEKNKQKLVQGKISELSVLESQCDSEVSKVVVTLKELLKEAGKDTSLATDVENAYKEEKSLKKAYYIKELG